MTFPSLLGPKEEEPFFRDWAPGKSEGCSLGLKAGGMGSGGHMQQLASCVESVPGCGMFSQPVVNDGHA